MRLFIRLLKNEEGQGMIEYALIISLVAIALIAALILVSGTFTNIFNKINTEVTNVE